MDFSTTHEQDLLRDTARQLLANECPPALLRAHLDDRSVVTPLWERMREFTELGLHSATDLVLFLFETGYVAAPGPFFATALCAPLLDSIASDGHLYGLLRHGTRGAVAIAGPSGLLEPHPGTTKHFVLDADLADVLVVVEPGPHVRALDVREHDVQIRVVETVDPSRHAAEVSVNPSAGDAIAVSPEVFDAWRDRATVALAAEMVGTARRIFDMALAHAKDRHQFGVPIGSFQAIQHKLAEMALVLERATAAVQYSAMTIDADAPDRTRAAHVAKAAAGIAARRMVKDGAQIHGGIGYTWEHDLHLFLRRATADEYLFGTTGWHHDRLADLLFSA